MNVLLVNDNAICSGSSGQSFVNGPVSKVGDDDFVFPVGKGSIYAPVAITGSGGTVTDRFTAEYFRANPQSTAGLGNVVAPPLHHVSYVEYWNLVREVGTSVKTVGLTVTAESFAKTLSTLSTAQYSAGAWQDRGVASIVTGPPAPPYATGSFTSANALNDFGSFTIGATDDGMTNPLPLQLMSFTVTASANDHTMIQWEIAPSADSAVFEIERGDDGRQFNAIVVMQKQVNTVRYAYEDPLPLPGINYYRLKIRNGNSDTQYSRIGIAQYNRTIVKLTAATPFITTDQSLFILESPVTMQSELLLLDMMGNVRTRRRQLLAPGKTSVHLPTANLVAGIYIVYAVTARGNTQVVRCIKL